MTHDFEVMKICVVSYLTSIRQKELALNKLSEKLATVRSKLESRGVSYDGTSSKRNPSDDRMSEGISKIIELEDEINERAAAWAEGVRQLIDNCDLSYLPRWICYLKWGEGKRWRDVSREVCYSDSQTRNLAAKGIRELYPLIPEEFRRDSIPNALVG